MKIKLTGLLLATLFASNISFAQVLKPQTDPKSNKIGLVDGKGKFVVKPQFATVGQFADGIYVLADENNTKVLYRDSDPKGKPIVTDLRYLSEPDDNRLVIYRNRLGKWGFLNLKGEKIGQEYSAVFAFNMRGENVAMVNNGGKYTQNADESINAVTGGKWGLIDLTGAEILKCDFAIMNYRFYEGLMAVGDGKKFGFVDAKGRVIVKPQYDDVGMFSEGMAMIKDNGLYGYIDRTGKVVVKPIYKSAGAFVSGLAQVGGMVPDPANKKKTMLRYGFIDVTGKVAVPLKYEMVDALFVNGVARVSAGKSAMGLINARGEEITPLVYSSIGSLTGDIIRVSKDALLITQNYITDPSNPKKTIQAEGVADLPENIKLLLRKPFVLNEQFKAEPYTWSDISLTSIPAVDARGRIVDITDQGVVVGGKYGFINHSGKEVVACNYDYVDRYCENVALAVKQGKCSWLDKSGKPVLSVNRPKAGPFLQGRAFVFDGKNYGIIDNKGREVVQCIYSSVGSGFQDGLLPVKKSAAWGCIDLEGNVVVPASCDSIDDVCAIIKNFYLPQGRKPLTAREVKLYRFTKTGAHNAFSIKDEIPDNMWDY